MSDIIVCWGIKLLHVYLVYDAVINCGLNECSHAAFTPLTACPERGVNRRVWSQNWHFGSFGQWGWNNYDGMWNNIIVLITSVMNISTSCINVRLKSMQCSPYKALYTLFGLPVPLFHKDYWTFLRIVLFKSNVLLIFYPKSRFFFFPVEAFVWRSTSTSSY